MGIVFHTFVMVLIDYAIHIDTLILELTWIQAFMTVLLTPLFRFALRY